MSGWKKLAAASAAGGGIPPEGISFNGDTSYLKTTSISGQSSSATYTFSVWFYYAPASNSARLLWLKNSSNTYFEVRINPDYNSSQSLDCRFSESGSNKLSFYNSQSQLGQRLDYGWHHLLLSVNNSAYPSSGDNAAIAYLNDQKVPLTFWGSAGSALSFNEIWLGRMPDANGGALRMAHAYISYSYTDLDVTANRRNFITEDLKPATGQASLNPLVYLPLTDSSTAASNEGTGGDFTVVGTLDTAGRGPNQSNLAATQFNGSNAGLKRSSALSGISDGKQVTFSCNFTLRSFNEDPFISFEAGGGYTFTVRTTNAGDYGYLTIIGVTPSETYAVQFAQPGTDLKFYLGRNHSLQVSFDLTDTSKRHIIIDGEEITGLTWPTYNNTNIDFTSSPVKVGWDPNSSRYLDGEMGELYFDTVYTDLASDNPFWDADTNLHKPVQQVLDETGNTPLMAMPLNAAEAENNLGTGGAFDEEGILTGGRGGSEFRSRGFRWSNTGQYLSNSNIGGSSSSQYLTVVVGYKTTGPTGIIGGPVGSGRMRIDTLHNTGYRISILDSSGSDIVEATIPYFAHDTNWHVLLYSFDMGSTANRHTWFTNYYGTTRTVLPNYNKYDTSKRFNLGSNFTLYLGRDDAASNATGDMSFVYLDDSYIDFSQEANRLKFVDNFGFPKDLTPGIESGNITNPLVYMKFDDPDNLGTNSGTGGNFTLTGSPNVGSDVNY